METSHSAAIQKSFNRLPILRETVVFNTVTTSRRWSCVWIGRRSYLCRPEDTDHWYCNRCNRAAASVSWNRRSERKVVSARRIIFSECPTRWLILAGHNKLPFSRHSIISQIDNKIRQKLTCRIARQKQNIPRSIHSFKRQTNKRLSVCAET